MIRWLKSWFAGLPAVGLPFDLEPVSTAPRPPSIPALELWALFQSNIVDAEDAFVGKVVRVVGTVERVERRGEGYVLALARLRGTQRIVEVTFGAEDREELVGLRPGDSVVVMGTIGQSDTSWVAMDARLAG